MAEVVVATLNVSFSDDTDTTGGGELKLEIDDREDGGNSGDTSFAPGDDVFFFLFKGNNVTLVPVDGQTIAATAGGVSSVTTGVVMEKEENISFSNSESASTGYPIESVLDKKWLGKCWKISGSTATGNTAEPEYTTGSSELKMKGKIAVAGVFYIKYTTKGDLYKLSGVPEDFLEVLLLSIGTVGV